MILDETQKGESVLEIRVKIRVKRGDFDFDIVNFPFLDGDNPRATSYGVDMLQRIRFTRVYSHADFKENTQRTLHNLFDISQSHILQLKK